MGSQGLSEKTWEGAGVETAGFFMPGIYWELHLPFLVPPPSHLQNPVRPGLLKKYCCMKSPQNLVKRKVTRKLEGLLFHILVAHLVC